MFKRKLYADYLTDWQDNNVAVINNKGDIVQKTAYYPYGEPTVEPSGQRFLFGGKEREHAAGRNTYDFSARCLTPYGNWNVNDQKAEKYYNLSPYSYCAGDPINFIDPDGKETRALSKDPKIKIYAANVKDDPNKLIIYSHGNTRVLDDDTKADGAKIRTSDEFIETVNSQFMSINDVRYEDGVEIVIKACLVGGDTSNGKENLAKQLSKSLKNAFITAPVGKVELNYTTDGKKTRNLSERVVDKEGRTIQNGMRTYFRGNEIQSSHIPEYKKF